MTTPVAVWKRQPVAPLLDLGDDRPHAVYSIFDAAGALIYVGMSCEPRTRIRSHYRSASWGSEMDTWSAAWYSDRATAEAAEITAIEAGAPRHNVYRTARFSERCTETTRHRYRQSAPWQKGGTS